MTERSMSAEMNDLIFVSLNSHKIQEQRQHRTRRKDLTMNATFREQMSIDDISTATNTQQSTSASQNASSQEKAHEYKQRLAESVQTTPESVVRNDTAQQSANRPKSASQSDFRRNLTQEHSAVTNDNEYSASCMDSCETASSTTEPKRRQRKAQRDNTSPICNMQMLTPDDIMQALRLSRSTVYNMLKRGEIPTVKIGNMLRVNKSDFERWLEQHTTAAHAV